jgi:hypothetical protein
MHRRHNNFLHLHTTIWPGEADNHILNHQLLFSLLFFIPSFLISFIQFLENPDNDR